MVGARPRNERATAFRLPDVQTPRDATAIFCGRAPQRRKRDFNKRGSDSRVGEGFLIERILRPVASNPTMRTHVPPRSMPTATMREAFRRRGPAAPACRQAGLPCVEPLQYRKPGSRSW